MYNPSDILIRKTTDGETIWLSQRLVVECCGVSEEHLRTVVRNRYKNSLPASWAKLSEKSEFYLGDSGKAWRWGRKAGQYYYDYDRIPDRAPTSYRSMIPTKEELVEAVEAQNLRCSRERDTQRRATLLEAVSAMETNDDANYIITNSGYQIDIASARDYGRALAWCRLIKRTVATRQFDLYGVSTVAAFYELCAQTLSTLKIKNLRTNTVKSLRNKIATMPSDIYEQRQWIVSGKWGNENRKIVGKIQLVDYETGVVYPFDIHQAIMYAAYMNFDGPEKETLTALYNEVYAPLMVEYGGDPVEYRTFCNHLSNLSARLLNDRTRHGTEHYKKQLLTYIPSEKLQYAHSLFCGDGSGLFAYRYTTAKGELNYMNLYAILITDVATGYIAGWAAAPQGSHVETPEMVRQAVRMATINSGKQTMFEFVSDNHGAFTDTYNKEWLRDAFSRVRTIAPHNSQANPAETMFRLFKNSTLRSMRNFVRTSHNATIGNRANLDKIETWEYPTYSEALVQLGERVAMWNNTPRRGADATPAELFATNKNPRCQPTDTIQLRRIFGTRTQTEVSRMRGFVTVGAKGNQTMYEIADYETTGAEMICRASGNQYYTNLTVVYDETAADLYSADGKYVMTCERVGKASQSYAEKSEEQRLNQQHLKERKERQMEVVAAHERDVKDAMSLLSGEWDYEAAVKFGGSKESINGEFEGFVDTEIKASTQKQIQKSLHRIERAEKRKAESASQKEAATVQSGHQALISRRIPEIYK